MANQTMVFQCLEMFGATFNKNKDWQGSVSRVWEASLEHVKDKDLWDATLSICKKNFEYPPTLGVLLEEVEVVVKARGGTGISGNQYNFCTFCEKRQGYVEVCAHMWVHEKKKMDYWTTMCRCDCDGASKRLPNAMVYSELYHRLYQSQKVDLIAWHTSSHKTPYLPMEVRNPERYQAMKERQAHNERIGKYNPFMTVVNEAQRAIDISNQTK